MTRDEILAFPEAGMFDGHYVFFGSIGIKGDDLLFVVDDEGVVWKPECRRVEKNGPDVMVKVRVNI